MERDNRLHGHEMDRLKRNASPCKSFSTLSTHASLGLAGSGALLKDPARNKCSFASHAQQTEVTAAVADVVLHRLPEGNTASQSYIVAQQHSKQRPSYCINTATITSIIRNAKRCRRQRTQFCGLGFTEADMINEIFAVPQPETCTTLIISTCLAC